jgi:hypothetical protein
MKKATHLIPWQTESPTNASPAGEQPSRSPDSSHRLYRILMGLDVSGLLDFKRFFVDHFRRQKNPGPEAAASFVGALMRKPAT